MQIPFLDMLVVWVPCLFTFSEGAKGVGPLAVVLRQGGVVRQDWPSLLLSSTDILFVLF